MPIHNWGQVDAGIFHDFHQAWTIALIYTLNESALPRDFFAMVQPVGDAVLMEGGHWFVQVEKSRQLGEGGAIALAEVPPQVRFTTSAEPDRYAARANRIAIKHRLGEVVAIIEIISPGNKNSQHALRSFVEKSYELLTNGINLLVVDLFPPSRRDPQGIHKAIWDTIMDESFESSADGRRLHRR